MFHQLSCNWIIALRWLVVERGKSSAWGRPEASCWGHGKLPRCSGGAPGGAGAWTGGASTSAIGAGAGAVPVRWTLRTFVRSDSSFCLIASAGLRVITYRVPRTTTSTSVFPAWYAASMRSDTACSYGMNLPESWTLHDAIASQSRPGRCREQGRTGAEAAAPPALHRRIRATCSPRGGRQLLRPRNLL